MFDYNPQCKQVRNCILSPMACEQQQKLKLQDIYEKRGYSPGYKRAFHSHRAFVDAMSA